MNLWPCCFYIFGKFYVYLTLFAKFRQSHPTLCDHMDHIHQVPLSMGFCRWECWRGLPCIPPGNLLDLGTEFKSLMFLALAAGFFTTSASWEACPYFTHIVIDLVYFPNVIKHFFAIYLWIPTWYLFGKIFKPIGHLDCYKMFATNRMSSFIPRDIYFNPAAAAKSCPTLRPHRRQLTRICRPWDSPGKNTGVGCHFLLQCMKVKSESEVAQSCPTLSHPMDCSPWGFSVHGIFQARVLEWVKYQI